jgi:hypothetical protein
MPLSDFARPLKPAENGDVYYIAYINYRTGYLFANCSETVSRLTGVAIGEITC